MLGPNAGSSVTSGSTTPVAGSTREILLGHSRGASALDTQTNPSPAARSTGVVPVANRVSSFVSGSIREIVLSSAFRTHDRSLTDGNSRRPPPDRDLRDDLVAVSGSIAATAFAATSVDLA